MSAAKIPKVRQQKFNLTMSFYIYGAVPDPEDSVTRFPFKFIFFGKLTPPSP